jgi:sortase A
LLPPVRIPIPRIGVNWPVVLSTNDHLPRFKGVGWFLGSAYPGAAGNIVLFGHLDGPYSTFARLRELRAGDEVRVFTETQTHHYRVRTAFETTVEDVSVLAPTTGATATFITCSGQWNSTLHAYDHRLIVLADYLGP